MMGDEFRAGIAGAEGDFHRMVQIFPRNGRHARGHGGGKEPDFAFGRHHGENFVDIFQKPHVQHFIGFIQHRIGDLRKTDALAADQIDEPPRGGHDDLGALFNLAELVGDARPAVNGHHPDTLHVCGKSGQVISDLHAQFTGRAKHDALRLGIGRIHQLEQGQSEGPGFSGAGLGQAHKIRLTG